MTSPLAILTVCMVCLVSLTAARCPGDGAIPDRDRCPFPPDANGEWPPECFDKLGKQCECIDGDMLLPQRQCVLMGLPYETHLLSQMYLETARGNSIGYLWDCYIAIQEIRSNKITQEQNSYAMTDNVNVMYDGPV